MINLNLKGKGGLEKKIDLRNYRLEVLGGAVTYPTKFSLRDKIGKIKDQGSSLSCGSQASSYYAQLLNFLETGKQVELSARDIYSLIYQPEGGQYVSDSVDKVCKSGVVLEADAPSYENGQAPTEGYMRIRSDIDSQEVEKGMDYLARKYVTWDNSNVEMYKQAIYQGNGAIVASWGNNYLWQGKNIMLPDYPSQMVWRHIVYLIGYNDETRMFEFVNSWGEDWGEKGCGYLPYDYVLQGYVSNPVTLIDLPNGEYSRLMKIKNILINLIDLYKKLLKK